MGHEVRLTMDRVEASTRPTRRGGVSWAVRVGLPTVTGRFADMAQSPDEHAASHLVQVMQVLRDREDLADYHVGRRRRSAGSESSIWSFRYRPFSSAI